MICILQQRFLITDMTLEPMVKVEYTSNQIYGLNRELLFRFLTEDVYILFAYSEKITTKGTDNGYVLGVEGQCQIYLKSVLRLITQGRIVFLTEALPILHNGFQYDLCVKVERIYGPQREKTCLRGVCEQHRRRPACASTQSDQRLFYSLLGKHHM